MIDGINVIYSGTEISWVGNFLGIIIVFAILIFSFEVVISIKERRGDVALALAICIGVLIVLFNPITELFMYDYYVVKVENYVTYSDLTENYVIMEQNDDGTLVLKEKASNGKS